MAVAPAVAGAIFGAALTTSRVHLPSVITAQMELRDFYMMEVFLTAIAASGYAMELNSYLHFWDVS